MYPGRGKRRSSNKKQNQNIDMSGKRSNHAFSQTNERLERSEALDRDITVPLFQFDQLDRRDIKIFRPCIIVQHRSKQHAGEDDDAPIHGFESRIPHGREEDHDERKDEEHQRQDIDEEAPSAEREILAARRSSSLSPAANPQPGHGPDRDGVGGQKRDCP